MCLISCLIVGAAAVTAGTQIYGAYQQGEAQVDAQKEALQAAKDAEAERQKEVLKQANNLDATNELEKFKQNEEYNEVKGKVNGQIAYNMIKAKDNKCRANLKEGLARSMGFNEVTKFASWFRGTPSIQDNQNQNNNSSPQTA